MESDPMSTMELAPVHIGAADDWSPLAEMNAIVVIEKMQEGFPHNDLPREWSLVIHGHGEIRCRNIRELVMVLTRTDVQDTDYPMTLMRIERLSV